MWVIEKLCQHFLYGGRRHPPRYPFSPPPSRGPFFQKVLSPFSLPPPLSFFAWAEVIIVLLPLRRSPSPLSFPAPAPLILLFSAFPLLCYCCMSSALTLGPRLSVFQPTLSPFCPPFYSHQERRRDRNDFQRLLPFFPRLLSSRFWSVSFSLLCSFFCAPSPPPKAPAPPHPPPPNRNPPKLGRSMCLSPLFSPPYHSFSPLQNGAILPGLNLRLSQGGISGLERLRWRNKLRGRGGRDSLL